MHKNDIGAYTLHLYDRENKKMAEETYGNMYEARCNGTQAVEMCQAFSYTIHYCAFNSITAKTDAHWPDCYDYLTRVREAGL